MSLPEQFRRGIVLVTGGKVAFDEPMRRHTTLRVGGPADAFLQPVSVDQLAQALRLAAENNVSVTAVGSGSNLLVRDGGVRGLVITLGSLREIKRLDARHVRIEAGVSTGKLLLCATDWELGGVEFLGGVPGSVGGGLVMNAGTYLGEFKDVTKEVESLKIATGAHVKRTNAECGFRYRHSDLPKDEIVVAATLELKPRPRGEIEADVTALRARRKEREPHAVANAGSFFKNPPNDFAGRLIEATGLKGFTVGEAQVSPKHANWIVNLGKARAADILEIIRIARERVAAQFGITLELEVKILGEDSTELNGDTRTST